MKCPLCPTGQGLEGRKKGQMKFEDFKNILDQTGDVAYSLELYSWGEPFLNAEIFDMIGYATKEKHLDVHVSSTLQHFPDDYPEKLVESGLELLIVSLDGTNQESYEKYRVGGDYQKTIENIKKIVATKERLKSNTPFMDIRFLVMKHNTEEQEAVKQLAQELRVDHIQTSPVMVNIKDQQEVNEWLPEDESESGYDYAAKRKKEERPTCTWLWDSIAVSWDGCVAPCCHLYHSSTDFGDLNKNRFQEIWNNEKYQKAREFIKSPRLTEEPPTIACELCLKPYLEADDKSELDYINESLTNKLKINEK